MRFAPYIIGGAIFIIPPLFMHSYLQGIAAKVLIFALFAMSLDLIYGYTGLWSLGHAVYFGVAGYTVGKLMVSYGINSFWIGLPLGILMAGLIAVIFGFIALRVSGMYFLLVTFALGELLYNVVYKWEFLSTFAIAGVLGISLPNLGIPWFSWSGITFYYFVFVIFVVCFFLLRRIINSSFGLSLQGIREDEGRMKSLGYNTWAYKYIAFIIAGLFAGVAGVLFAYYNGSIFPQDLGISASALVMVIVIIGGTGTLFGSIIGAALILLLEHFMSLITPERWPLILGAVFIASAMYARGGIGLYLLKLWKKVSEQYGIVKN